MRKRFGLISLLCALMMMCTVLPVYAEGRACGTEEETAGLNADNILADEKVKPTAIRRVTPEDVELHPGYFYRAPGVMRIAYDPANADTSTEWKADSTILADLSGNLYPTFRLNGLGKTKVTATSKANPELSTSFNVTVKDGLYEKESFTTDVLISRYEGEKTYDTVQNPDVYEMKAGQEYLVRFKDEGEMYIPMPESRVEMFEKSKILQSGKTMDTEEKVGATTISASPAVVVSAKTAGEETYTAGSRKFTIRVTDTPVHVHLYELDDWTWADDYSWAYAEFVCQCGDSIKVHAEITEEDNVYTATVKYGGATYTDTRIAEKRLIREAFMTSEIFREPKIGEAITWASDMSVPENSGYLTPAQFNEKQHSHGVGDVEGVWFLGTIEHPERRITWDYIAEAGDSAYYRFSLYTDDEYEFADTVDVVFNDRHADRVYRTKNSLTAYFQFGPFEEEKPDPETISFDKDEYEITVGQIFELIPHIEPESAKDAQLTWTVSNPKIASNDSSQFKGLKAGRTEVTVTSVNGVSATCVIRVLFTDVPAKGKYYSDAVYWAVENSITNGYTDDDKLARTFRPQNNCTREAVVTFLWRLAGKPEPQSMESTFPDVQDPGKYYYKAVLWAAEKGITGGYDDGTFRPDETCLREHVVTFLYRYAGRPKPETEQNPFNDVTPKDYYYKAALWANEKGIAKGYKDGEYAGGFGPKLDCLREHVVTFLYRYDRNVSTDR